MPEPIVTTRFKHDMRPSKLAKADRKKARVSRDKSENVKVWVRSKGRCELRERRLLYDGGPAVIRCDQRAMQIHHRLGGIGVRGRGASALAENKLHLCAECHSDVHAHVLVPDGKYFRRVK